MSSIELKYKRLKRRKRRNIILNTVCLLIASSGLLWTINYFWRYISYEITNDASVDQYISPVNVRVAGYVQDIRFREHQFVHKGDTLVVLDNREYLIRQKEAEAALMDAQGSKGVLHSNIETSETHIAEQSASLEEAKARLWKAEQDFHRYERLLREESVPEQQYDQAKADFDAARARYNALLRQKDAARSQYTETSRRKVNIDAAILRAEAALDLANLNLSYTVVTAPYDGYMGRRTLEPGQYVSAGQTLSYLVRQMDKWVTANYRETQIANIYIGQQVLPRDANRQHLHRTTCAYQGGRHPRQDIPRTCHGHLRSHRLEILPRPDRQLGRQLRQSATTHTRAHRLRRRHTRRHGAAPRRHDGHHRST